MSSKVKLRQDKKGRKGYLRADAERTASPRIKARKVAASKATRAATKRKRLNNLRRGAPKIPTLLPVKNELGGRKSASRPVQKHLPEAERALQNPAIQPCKKGQEHSAQIIMLMIRVCSLFVTLSNTVTSAVIKTAKLFGAGKELVRRHVMLWYTKKEIRPPGKKRGRGSAHYGDDNHILKQAQLSSLSNFIDNNNKKAGGMTTIRTIRNFLQREFGVRYNRSAIYYALRVRLGYVYARPTSRCVIMTDTRRRRLQKHWLQRDLAIKAERRGDAIMVFMDESYVHQNHFPKDCWFHPDRPTVTRPRGKGQRLIIVHAISKDGLVRYCARGDDNPPAPGEFDSSIHPTSEMIFRAKSARGDYHDQMDCDTFMMWLDRRLVPAFEAKYPGKKMVLVLDNAPYHHGRRDDGFWCKENNKGVIADKLRSLGCPGLRIKMDFSSAKDAASGGAPPSAASTPEEFIGWYLLDTDDNECWEVTHFADDDSDYDQGQVICVTKMGVQRGEKTWFSLDEDRAATHGLQTFQALVRDGVFKVIGYGDETYNRISKFWRRHRQARRRQKPDPAELLLDPAEVAAAAAAAGEDVTAAPKHHFYPIDKLSLRYNGRGEAGTGGPKTEWLRKAGDRYISMHHPHLHDTRLMRYCREHGIQLVFTAPYEFDSQPIENVWRDVKGEVARQYYPRRTITDTRKQLLRAFNTRITGEFCAKLIKDSEVYLNEQIASDPIYSKLGKIGEFVNPPTINASDEMIDFDGIDLTHDDDVDDDDDGYEDC